MISKDILVDLYLDNELSQSQIADILKVSKTTVRNYMKKYKIKARQQENKDKDYLSLHERWRSIQRRCRRDEIEFYSDWRNYDVFKKWSLQNGWQEKNAIELAITRIDWEDGYYPSNCIVIPKLKVHETHMMTKTRLYHIWQLMLSRCNNTKNQSFKHYGGRGITVCREWEEDFLNFYTWSMNHGYNEDLTIDRIDVNGNYEPNNCRWATWLVQGNNRRDTIYIEFDGRKQSIKDWSRELNISYTILYNRYKDGVTDEDKLFSRKSNKREPILITINNTTDSLSGWAKRTGLSRDTIKKRYNRGLRGESIIAPAKGKRREEILVEINGEKKSLRQWGITSGIANSTIHYRYRSGVRGEALLSEPNNGIKNPKRYDEIIIKNIKN